MATLDHYPFAVFLHILGALGLFVALGIEWLAVLQLRQAAATDQSIAWVRTLSTARRIGPLSMALIIVPGVLMALTRWNFLAWPAAGLVGMAEMVAVGLLLSRTPKSAVVSVEIRIAIAVGIVAVMVFKPDLFSSLMLLAAATIVGTGASRIGHRGGTGDRGTLQRDSLLPHRELQTISGEYVSIPDNARLVHLQFRRFAGCPVCSLHLRSVVRRHDEIVNACIREVVVFHSSREELLEQAADLPFAVVADPRKELYAEFGVESSPRALLDPRVWLPILVGVARSAINVLARQRRAPSLMPTGGRLGLPADFLIASDGRLLAVKYGSHAYDQWSVDELLALAQPAHNFRRGAVVPKPGTALT